MDEQCHFLQALDVPAVILNGSSRGRSKEAIFAELQDERCCIKFLFVTAEGIVRSARLRLCIDVLVQRVRGCNVSANS